MFSINTKMHICKCHCSIETSNSDCIMCIFGNISLKFPFFEKQKNNSFMGKSKKNAICHAIFVLCCLNLKKKIFIILFFDKKATTTATADVLCSICTCIPTSSSSTTTIHDGATTSLFTYSSIMLHIFNNTSCTNYTSAFWSWYVWFYERTRQFLFVKHLQHVSNTLIIHLENVSRFWRLDESGNP